MDLRLSREATTERFGRKNSLQRELLETPLGRRLAARFITPLIDFFSGKQSVTDAYPAPPWLAEAIKSIEPEVLALVTLEPVLDAWYRGGLNEKSPLRDLKQKIGERLDEHLRFGWDNEKRVKAGHWMLDAALLNLNCFTLHKHGIEIIPASEAELDQLRDEMMRNDPAWCPFTEAPPDWTGFRKLYGDGFEDKFVSGARQPKETEKAINKAFESEFQHGLALNRLKSVRLLIDKAVLPLVERYGGEVANRKSGNYGRVEGKDKKAKKLARKLANKCKATTRLVDDDCRMARNLEGRRFWLDYQTDFRGRLYSLQYLNYAREDHVRALFKFANGHKLGQLGLSILEIHCANCEGETEKKSYKERLEWAQKNKASIQKIAADPVGTFKIWSKAEKPFQYIAACIELDAAWKDPEGFVSHIPVSFDGSANGLQHLSILSRDEDALRRVNLDSRSRAMGPQDVYTDILQRTKHAVVADAADKVKEAQWWKKRFADLSDGKARKIVKRPVMTYPYNVTTKGMKEQIVDAYAEIGDGELDYKAAWYLAKTVRKETEKLLKGPAKIMGYIREIARHCNKEGRFLKYTTSSAFPFVNVYLRPNIKRIKLRSRRGGVVVAVQHKVGIGWKREIRKTKARNAAAPNFIHAIDAEHLVRTVNTAALFPIDDILTVHDCYACHAANANNLHDAIRRALIAVHWAWKPLERLRGDNVVAGEILPLPALGELTTEKIIGILKSPYSWD